MKSLPDVSLLSESVSFPAEEMALPPFAGSRPRWSTARRWRLRSGSTSAPFRIFSSGTISDRILRGCDRALHGAKIDGVEPVVLSASPAPIQWILPLPKAVNACHLT